MADFTYDPVWIQKIETRFDALDVNKNGYIDNTDFRAFAKNLSKIHKVGPEKEEEYYQKITQVYYNQGHGETINKQQFVENMRKLVARPDARKILEDYSDVHRDILDINKDGVISFKEYEALLVASNLGKEVARKFFTAMDTDGDGVISIEELSKCVLDYICSAKPVA